ncbi:hypothetical protein DDB_G0274733 [Dictyostelium discoideum AX4]|uniref:Uncharacterized protein n=1 Tax=Dictyostelium discoideum TaxID=44689 RepID=Q555U4_DICDI|nr:hypothetical protein DDB_G0274733 [Dictyostelium discoideum AX4]EAL70259.1 hypothetical protein DDB_G0274733 [Dictyostelium discoideum AX4]|eukprot:XP_643966.1 hypothetical protein DDB_G0274733 [Dictyostelium discoideum AX4]
MKISNYYIVEDFDISEENLINNINYVAKARKQNSFNYYLIIGRPKNDNNYKKEVNINFFFFFLSRQKKKKVDKFFNQSIFLFFFIFFNFFFFHFFFF